MDLFTVNDSYSIAHYISGDRKMNKGITLDLCNKYGNMAPTLYNLNPKIGDAILVNVNGRVIYFLFTKNTLNDGKDEKVTSVFELLELSKLSYLPNYWFNDDELAVIANYTIMTYIFNDIDKSGIIYSLGNRPPIVLYNVDKYTHWIPGTKSHRTIKDIPLKTINFTEHESIDNLKKFRCQSKVK
ncbi:uncharacterized protein LOC126905208 [Daktulosphaira vitifoliae]|uniref:uncharacterized protein LOC126905208 n=1 Tax=Daktulosphaira vitifoliae TaxID=58002 RepID=UPI0021AAF0B4|nr:uncharacterized protein LOC126905208 [Daktulosphaira vitifoliae]